MKEGTNLDDCIRRTQAAALTNVQPYIICVTNGQTHTYFIQGDGWILHRHDKTTIISSFDLLFKLFYTLNLSYSAPLMYFFNFFEVFIYKTSDRAGSMITSMHINISNLDLQACEDVTLSHD